MCWSVDINQNSSWWAPKKNVDCFIPFWIQSQTLLQVTSMWLPLVYSLGRAHPHPFVQSIVHSCIWSFNSIQISKNSQYCTVYDQCANEMFQRWTSFHYGRVSQLEAVRRGCITHLIQCWQMWFIVQCSSSREAIIYHSPSPCWSSCMCNWWYEVCGDWALHWGLA